MHTHKKGVVLCAALRLSYVVLYHAKKVLWCVVAALSYVMLCCVVLHCVVVLLCCVKRQIDCSTCHFVYSM